MKKTLAFFVAVCMIATFSTCVFAKAPLNPPDPFNFDNLLQGKGNIKVNQGYDILNSQLINGFWIAAKDNSSLDSIISTTTLNNIPVFILTNPTVTTRIFPASNLNEKDKKIILAHEYNRSWSLISPQNFSQPIRWKDSSETIGYTSDLYFGIGTDNDNKMFLFVSSNNQVYPLIIVTTNLDSGIEPIWEENFPKNNEELTMVLQQTFHTDDNYTFYINPVIHNNYDSGNDLDSSNTSTRTISINPNRRPHYTISTASTEGGTVSTVGEELLLVGNLDQKYTIAADEGYTIAYVIVDGQIVPNSINCGDMATFTFDCIYGNRSISAVFKKK